MISERTCAARVVVDMVDIYHEIGEKMKEMGDLTPPKEPLTTSKRRWKDTPAWLKKKHESTLKGFNDYLTSERAPEGAAKPEEYTQAAKVDKLNLPDFYGECLELEYFESTFKTLIDTCRYNQESKTLMLKEHLKGPAADFIGKEGRKHMTYDEIWAALKKKYGKSWMQTRSATKNLFNIEAPSDDHEQVEKYMNRRRDALKAMTRLDITLDQAIANDTLNNLPQSIREKIDEKLIPLYEDYKMSFEQCLIM